MKFDYTSNTGEIRKPVAWLFKMESISTQEEFTLCIATTNPEKFIWMYEDGDITIQNTKPNSGYKKKFYPGDSITITF